MHDHEWNSLRPILKDERAVERAIAEARPYVRYGRGDTATVYADGRWADVPSKQRGPVFTQAANIVGGLIITKHPVPGAGPVLPQMRPDRPVRVHLTKAAKDGHEHASMSATARAAHVEGKSHAGENPDALHGHVEDGLAKYLLTPKAITEWDREHTHRHGQPSEAHWHYEHRDGQLWDTSDPEPELLRIVRDPADVAVRHKHRRKGKDPRTSPEKRLDMNPLAAEMLPTARRVFFSIEGSIKADALLSKGECAFAVPSVTMWSAPELGEFAERHLVGKKVYVVPDADWADNPMVATQAFLAARYLKQQGVDAAVASSPREKGIDDYLAAGGSVDGMRVRERVMPPAFGQWRAGIEHDIAGIGGKPARAGIVETVELLSMLSNEDGQVVKPGRDLLRYVSLSPKRLEAALDRLTGDWPALTGEVGMPPVYIVGAWALDARWWEETPVYQVRGDLRPIERDLKMEP